MFCHLNLINVLYDRIINAIAIVFAIAIMFKFLFTQKSKMFPTTVVLFSSINLLELVPYTHIRL